MKLAPLKSSWLWCHASSRDSQHMSTCCWPLEMEPSYWTMQATRKLKVFFAKSRFTQPSAYSLPMASFCRLVISRYTQWMVTTPTLIYVVSKISDFTRTQVATVVLCQFSVILTGLLSSVAPSPWKCEAHKHVHICCCFSTALISSTQHSINLSTHACMCSKAVT